MARKKASTISTHGQYYFDQKDKQFVTSKGVRLTTKTIPTMILEPLLSEQKPMNGSIQVKNADLDEVMDGDIPDKPEVPMVEVDYGKGRKGQEPNPNDGDFQEMLSDWQLQRNVKTMKLLFNMGIAERVPDEFSEMYLDIHQVGPATLKYVWVLSCLSGDEESAALTEIILGQNMPTANGVAEAEAIFPGDSGA